jgi:hypothetical protein
MASEAILDEIAARTGWNDESKLSIALEYIDNQGDDGTWENFLTRRAADEKVEDDPEVVVFRWPLRESHPQVYALFPNIEGSPGQCTCYQHVGQHASADYAGCITKSRPATPAEYAGLKRELESIGYTLRIRTRRTK